MPLTICTIPLKLSTVEHIKTIHLKARDFPDFVLFDKASGYNTHANDLGKSGIVEDLSRDLGIPLFVVHRLDQGTSGCLLFAKTKTAAAELANLFETHQIKKTYYFLTDKKSDFTKKSFSSFIEKRGNQFVSIDHSPNAETDFEFVSTLGPNYLWRAFPKTGKPHQIRLHAQSIGLAILGDHEHGGSPFYRLALHAAEISFTYKNEEFNLASLLPKWATTPGAKDSMIDSLSDSLESRTRMLEFHQDKDCLRLSHLEQEHFRVDQYGPQTWVYWYKDSPPDTKELGTFHQYCKKLNKTGFLRQMFNRGKDPNGQMLFSFGNPQDIWNAQENKVLYELRSNSGMSPGLFLDQRENRYFVRTMSKDKKVLNLFAYTGGFSVNAALGGASEVTTVDVSKNFNDWTKKNFELNGLDPHNQQYEFWTQDSMLFLKGAIKRGRKWDLIICDPPSFGRSPNGTFKIQKDIFELIGACLSCLSTGGQLLFSTNFEGWNQKELFSLLKSKGLPSRIQILPTPHQGFDFEKHSEEPLMKSILIKG